MAKKPLPLRIDEDLLRRVDEARGDVSRTRWVERALEARLGLTDAQVLRQEQAFRDIDGTRVVEPAVLPTGDVVRVEPRKPAAPVQRLGKGFVPPRPKGT